MFNVLWIVLMSIKHFRIFNHLKLSSASTGVFFTKYFSTDDRNTNDIELKHCLYLNIAKSKYKKDDPHQSKVNLYPSMVTYVKNKKLSMKIKTNLHSVSTYIEHKMRSSTITKLNIREISLGLNFNVTSLN